MFIDLDQFVPLRQERHVTEPPRNIALRGSAKVNKRRDYKHPAPPEHCC